MTTTTEQALRVGTDERTGMVNSVMLFGEELLDPALPNRGELLVNGKPLKTRWQDGHLKGEQFVDHFAGYGLVVARDMGPRTYMKYPCFGVHYLIRREQADMTDLPCPGPGGPVVEAPLYVDTFSLACWNWQFWGDDTRMIFPSLHSSGPEDEFGHVGYEHESPEKCKQFMQNVWRRIYPGVMGIHGGVFYNAKTGHWLAITCRRPNVGYILNINDAGRGVGYDFTLHAPFNPNDALQMPEIKIYYGQTHEEMMQFIADYLTFYYEEAPAWVFNTVFGDGLAWDNQPTWTAQADLWAKQLDAGLYNGISYCLVTNRPIHSGTSPTGYEPDPNHGPISEFKAMCHRVTDRGVPLLIWMSHTGVLTGGAEFDDDWFIRGIDGKVCCSWGSIDGGMTHCNPGHPGYIEYTKKWIRFYMRECGCKGIFLDCLGWAFPPDFRPRAFMRYPGDTNRMAIRFIEEVYACIKECDPEGILLGEGTTLEAPVNIFSIVSNPIRSLDGLGPRDFYLQLNQYSSKRLIIDQGPQLFPASGICRVSGAYAEVYGAYCIRLLREHSGRTAFTALPGDLSIHAGERLLFIPVGNARDVRLPAPWNTITHLREEITGAEFTGNFGVFSQVPTGIYRMG